MSEYKSPMTTRHRKHVYLDPQDPRAKNDTTLEDFRSKIGAKVIVNDQTIQENLVLLEDWPGGWYARSIDVGTYSPDIVSNGNNVFLSSDTEAFLILTTRGIQYGELINYVHNIWTFSKTPDGQILASSEELGEDELGEYLEAYYFLERFVINSARFFPTVPYQKISAAGGVYGDFYVLMNTETETSILKYLFNETKEWERTFDIVVGNTSCVDIENRVYFANDSVANLKVCSLDVEGGLRWAKVIIGIPNNNGETVKIFCSDSSLYVVGFCGTTSPDKDVFVINLDFDGNLIWSFTYNHDLDFVVKNASMGRTGILVCGALVDSPTRSDGVVMEIDDFGQVEWIKKMKSEYIPSIATKNDMIYGCGSDKNKNYISGIILKAPGITPRLFASGIGGAFPVGTYSLTDNYSFTISNTEIVRDSLALTINDITPNISVTSKIAINYPNAIYGDLENRGTGGEEV